jgi:hypothetical protein
MAVFIFIIRRQYGMVPRLLDFVHQHSSLLPTRVFFPFFRLSYSVSMWP